MARISFVELPTVSEMQARQRSAVVFGARNLGRAVIELLVSDGWAVTGVARSQSTLDGVSASGALALKADVTDPASVYDVLEQAAAAHGGVELALNAAAAYGGERSGPFGGGPIAEADLNGFDSWAAAPARAAFSFLSASGRFAIAQGGASILVQVTGGSARRAQDRRCRPLLGQPGRALRDTRAPAHPARRDLDALNFRGARSRRPCEARPGLRLPKPVTGRSGAPGLARLAAVAGSTVDRAGLGQNHAVAAMGLGHAVAELLLVTAARGYRPAPGALRGCRARRSGRSRRRR